MRYKSGMAYPRYTVSKEMDFSAAHFLREYRGECENLHGHNYRVRIVAGADELNDEGMVVDFAALKDAMRQAVARFDHRLINDAAPFDKLNPTLEHLAKHIGDEVAKIIDNERCRVIECRLWETDRNSATYRL